MIIVDDDEWGHHVTIERVVRIRPPQDVDVLAVLVLGRPGNFRKLTSSDVLVSVSVLVLAVLVQKILKNLRPRTSSSPFWSLSSSWKNAHKSRQRVLFQKRATCRI